MVEAMASMPNIEYSDAVRLVLGVARLGENDLRGEAASRESSREFTRGSL